MKKCKSSGGRVLAGEANKPGAFARKTINLIGDLDKADAESFQKLCRLVCVIDDQRKVPFVVDHADRIYTAIGIDFDTLSHLECMGLIYYQPLTGFLETDLPEEFTIKHFDLSATVILGEYDDRRVPVGTVLFTRAGLQLASICEATLVPNLLEHVCQHWVSRGIHIVLGDTPGATYP